MLVPDVASPTDRMVFNTDRFPLSEARKFKWPSGFDIQLIPAKMLDFSSISPTGNFPIEIAPSIMKHIKDTKPDVLFESPYTTLTPRSYLVYFSAISNGIPRVYVDPADYVDKGGMRKILNKIEKRVVNSTKAIITYSELGKKRFINDYATNPDKIIVLPKPVDTEKFHPGTDGSAFQDKYRLYDRRIITYVGRFAKNKGPEVLLDVAKHTNDNTMKFIFVGPGSKEYLDRVGLRTSKFENCIFTGNVNHDKVNEIMAISDLMVFPDVTNPPAFTTVLAESMAMGKAIILGAKGYEDATPIEHLANGVIVEPRNGNEIMRWIVRLLEDDSLRVRLGANARKYADEKMNWYEQVKIYKGIFNNIIESRN
jgi:glycosyltransferase involved in cell wall biosynthesis